jgi:hypothetical protein
VISIELFVHGPVHGDGAAETVSPSFSASDVVTPVMTGH